MGGALPPTEITQRTCPCASAIIFLHILSASVIFVNGAKKPFGFLSPVHENHKKKPTSASLWRDHIPKRVVLNAALYPTPRCTQRHCLTKPTPNNSSYTQVSQFASYSNCVRISILFIREKSIYHLRVARPEHRQVHGMQPLGCGGKRLRLPYSERRSP